MNPRLAAAVVNGALIAVSAIVLFPLLWMLSVSFMQAGEASAFPPPLLPAHATLANYDALFARAGMGRYLANSLAIATAMTLLSLAFNLSAGYAFAKLQLRRPRAPVPDAARRAADSGAGRDDSAVPAA